MDVLDEDLLNFWRAMNANGVRYIMVGGVAVNFHGWQRMTDDIDIWVDDTAENRKHLRSAFREYGFGDIEALERIQFIAGWTDFNLTSGTRIDLMSSIKGLESYAFDECFQLASIADIYGVKIPFLHINHLLEAKKATNRSKDQLDIIELNKIIQISKGKDEHPE